ncbi:aminodeoxychorismate synthase component I, partial [Rhizobium ruizarguesonis]
MAETQPTILFRDDVSGKVMLFAEPVEIIIARTRAEFFAGIARMEQ